MNIRAAGIMSIVGCLLVFAIAWGRSQADFEQVEIQHSSPPWTSNMQLLSSAWAGPIPALAADFAILTVFDIYDHIQSSSSPHNQEKLWNQLSFQLHKAQSMDPYFRDVYRLAEGLLAYEGNRITVRQNSGCKEAIIFLYSRLKILPERYRQGILRRITRYKESEICSRDKSHILAH